MIKQELIKWHEYDQSDDHLETLNPNLHDTLQSLIDDGYLITNVIPRADLKGRHISATIIAHKQSITSPLPVVGSIRIIKGANVKCKRCETSHRLDVLDFGNPKLDEEERTYSYETQYIWKAEKQCHKCNSTYGVEIEAYEYPKAMISHVEFKTKWCTMIQEPLLKLY
jgi:hypothetical protein